MTRYMLVLVLAILFPLVACSGPPAVAPAHPPEPPPSKALPTPPTMASPSSMTEALEPRVEVVASGLQVPWAVAFAPDGRLFVTERVGRIRVIRAGQLDPTPVATLDVSASGEGGLMGLALDPQFSQTGYLYVMYTYTNSAGTHNRISRLTLQGERAGNEMVLVDGIPGGRNHDGGRLEFGPDGKLYATTGETFRGELAQQASNLAGKILRLNPDGSVPDDNPFAGSLVYSLGHRNPQGLAWSVTGQLYSTEHGPSGEMGLCCRDELNRIEAGGNYGWPLVTTGTDDPRFVLPVLHSGDDTWAPSSLAAYKGTALAPWQGNLFFGALRGRHLHRVILSADGTVASHEQLFAGQYGRIRAVTEGPDGHLYFSTSNRDGRGTPAPDDDRILRVVPGP